MNLSLILEICHINRLIRHELWTIVFVILRKNVKTSNISDIWYLHHISNLFISDNYGHFSADLKCNEIHSLYHLHNDAVTVRYKWSLIISLISVLFEIWIYQATPQASFLWWLQCQIKRKIIWEKPCLGQRWK